MEEKLYMFFLYGVYMGTCVTALGFKLVSIRAYLVEIFARLVNETANTIKESALIESQKAQAADMTNRYLIVFVTYLLGGAWLVTASNDWAIYAMTIPIIVMVSPFVRAVTMHGPGFDKNKVATYDRFRSRWFLHSGEEK